MIARGFPLSKMNKIKVERISQTHVSLNSIKLDIPIDDHENIDEMFVHSNKNSKLFRKLPSAVEDGSRQWNKNRA